MKHLKRFLALVAISLGLSFVNPAHAGIPVIDASNLAQAVAQVSAWAKQYAQMEQEYQQMVAQLQNAQGVRGMANLVNDPASRNYLPESYSQILSQGVGDWQQMYQQLKSFNPSNSAAASSNPTDQFLDQGMKQAAINRAASDEAFDSASKRFQDIQVLLDKVNQAPDEKDILDLQGRIQAEQVMAQNETNKLSALKQATEAQQDLRDEQIKQIQIGSIDGGSPNMNW